MRPGARRASSACVTAGNVSRFVSSTGPYALAAAAAPARASGKFSPVAMNAAGVPGAKNDLLISTAVAKRSGPLIRDTGTSGWLVQSGDVPGDLFATNAIDTFVRFEAAQTAMDVVVVVTYIGLNESGAPFFGAMVGTAAI